MTTQCSLQEACNNAGLAYKKELTNYFFQHWGTVIRYGPFRGISIPMTDVYGVAKLLGLYECELHDPLQHIRCLDPDAFINVGCGDAYYCMGMTKLLANHVPIVGIDISKECIDSSRHNIAVNGLEGRIRLCDVSSPSILQRELHRYERPVVFMDCEGAERELLDPKYVPALLQSIILVELHPFVVAGIEELIQSRFAATHRIQTIRQGARNVHLPELHFIHENDKYLLCSEGRPITMEWMLLIPHTIPYMGKDLGMHAANYFAMYWQKQ